MPLIRDLLKNVRGWRTRERLVVFNVDDYGSIRLAGPAAKRKLVQSGLDLTNRFDRLDALETANDLEALFNVLSSFKDSTGRSPIFTAYTLLANPKFDYLRDHPGEYRYETLLETFDRLAQEQPKAYTSAWRLWQEGVQKGLLMPQFHGREHFNVNFIELKTKTPSRQTADLLEAKSMISLEKITSLPNTNLMQSFSFEDATALTAHKTILEDGTKLFCDIFGFKSLTFTPPGQSLHPELYGACVNLGVRGIDKPFRTQRHFGKGVYKTEFNVLGRSSDKTHYSIVRNVVFEPGEVLPGKAISRALQMIEAAFRMKKPAIISSHRVNFAGHIVPENRERGLGALAKLLSEILLRWPDVTFISADELLCRMDKQTP